MLFPKYAMNYLCAKFSLFILRQGKGNTRMNLTKFRGITVIIYLDMCRRFRRTYFLRYLIRCSEPAQAIASLTSQNTAN